MKKSTKIFITHFHKTFYLVIKRTFFVNLVMFFQFIALHTSSDPKSTLYTFYKFLVFLD